jgi:predicted DNA-binding transcriptional regulator AlpA
MSMMSETKLAERWGISPKTLQRWRTEKRGPQYIKLGKNVRYRLEDVHAYETGQRKLVPTEAAVSPDPIFSDALSSRQSRDTPTITKVNSITPVIDREFITGEEAMRLTKLPAYYFISTQVRMQQGIPHYMIAGRVRYKPSELCQWLLHRDSKKGDEQNSLQGSGAAHPSTQQITDPEPPKMGLHEALRRLKDGSLLR